MAGQFPNIMLRGDQSSGYAPCQYGNVESHSAHVLGIKTSTAETKGVLAGIGGMVSVICLGIALTAIIAGKGYWEFVIFLSVGSIFGVLAFSWELYRPFPLPIIFNRRTQEIYYDLNGKLYHAPWEGIEAVAYEYRNVNQYTGGMTHANLELILHRFSDPEDCIVLNIGGHPAGKRAETLAALWEYLRAFMNVGPWFDGNGQKAPRKTPFITEQLEKSEYSSKDNLKLSRRDVQRYKEAGEPVPVSIWMVWFGNLVFHPMSLIQSYTYRLCRARICIHWRTVAQLF
jgi:hypothetical protein